jgi:hypothetical protein
MKTLAIVLALALLPACSTTTTPNYDASFGNAVREAKQNMIINPDAGKEPDQVTGIDGKAARETVIRYHDSFKSPPAVTNVINIGGSLGGEGTGAGNQ